MRGRAARPAASHIVPLPASAFLPHTHSWVSNYTLPFPDGVLHNQRETWAWDASLAAPQWPWGSKWSLFANRVDLHGDSALEDIARLEDNWDGAGSLAPTPNIVEAARRIIRVLSRYLPRPEITPNDNGTITMEWRELDDYASLEVGATTFAFMIQFDRHKTRFENGLLAELNESRALEIEDALFWRRPVPTSAGHGWTINKVDY